MAADKKPANKTAALASKLVISFNCTSAAPRIAGIDSKKLNLAANSRLSPENNPAAIVAPDLEMPGAMAIP